MKDKWNINMESIIPHIESLINIELILFQVNFNKKKIYIYIGQAIKHLNIEKY